jgi:hypothetical protein
MNSNPLHTTDDILIDSQIYRFPTTANVEIEHLSNAQMHELQPVCIYISASLRPIIFLLDKKKENGSSESFSIKPMKNNDIYFPVGHCSLSVSLKKNKVELRIFIRFKVTWL